jgi:WD40 repeat protein
MSNTTVISRANPYVGPRSFKKGERLYGRERETNEILDLLIAERVVLMYSPSGAGKSSLLNAAILPKMEEQGFHVLPTMRVNHAPPKNALASDAFNRYIYSLILSSEEAQPEDKRFSEHEIVSLRFDDYLERYRERMIANDPNADPRLPFLIIVDQSEEVITNNPMDRTVKRDFFQQIGDALKDRSVWALFAIREDYLASFDPYTRMIPTRFANRYRMNLLGTEAALSAIRGPAEAQGVDFMEDAARKLVEDIARIRVQQPDGTSIEQAGLYVEPVQLQVVCRRLWSKVVERETTQITLADVAEAGDADSALADYYALQVAIAATETRVPEREIREWFDRKLITVQGIRGQVLLAPQQSDGLSNDAIFALERAYLVRAEKRGGATWFELAHDRLIRPVHDNNSKWFLANLSMLQRQADLWNEEGKPEGLLLFGKDYLEAEEWVSENGKRMNSIEADFITACRKLNHHMRRERQINTAIRWLFVTSVLMGIGAFYFFIRATNAEYKATARELAAAASYNVAIDPERSLLLAIEASTYTQEPLTEVEQSLHQALPAMRLEKTFSGHSDEVYRADFSPDGSMIASASYDGTIKIWSAGGDLIKDITLIANKQPYEFGAFDVRFSPDGKHLAAVDAKGRLTIFDAQTFAIVKQIQDQTDDSGDYWTTAVDYSRDGKWIVTAGTDPDIRVYDARTFALIRSIGGSADPNRHTDQIEDAVFSHNGKMIVSSGDDRTIRVWDAATGAFLFKLEPNVDDDEAVIFTAVFSPDDTRILSGGADRLIYVWDVAAQSQIMKIPGHLDWVFAIEYSPDGQMIISGSSDRTIRFWDAEHGRPVRSLVGHTDRVFGFTISPDGRHLISASGDRTLRLWNITKGGASELFAREFRDRMYGAAYSPDGKYFVTAGREKTEGNKVARNVYLYDAITYQPIAVVPGNVGSITPIHWTPDSKTFLTGSDDSIFVFDAETRKMKYVMQTDVAAHGAANGANFSPDGKLIGIAYLTGEMGIADAANGEMLKTLKSPLGILPDYVAYDLDFSPDGKYAAMAINLGIYLFDVETGKVAITLGGLFDPSVSHVDRVEAFSFSPDGKFLASVGDDGRILVWDLQAGDGNPLIASDTGHIGSIFNVKFTPDGKQIVSTGADARVIVWDFDPVTHTLSQHVQLYGHTDRIWGLDVSPDGKHVLTGSNDFVVRALTIDSAELIVEAKSRLTRSLNETECRNYFRASCADVEARHRGFLRDLVFFFRDTLGIIQ